MLKANYYQSRHNGHQAETMTEPDANGQAWQIHTSKGRGGIVECTAIKGQYDGRAFSYEMFGAKRLQLASLPGKATEAKIKEVHELGLKAFAEQVQTNSEEAKPYVIEKGQVLMDHDHERWGVVYEITRPGQYKAVYLDGSKIDRYIDHLKPIGEKFGIGTYYEEGDKMPAQEVDRLVTMAREAQTKRDEAERIAKEEAARERARKIEEGRKIISAIPSGVEAVIVAELHENTSDLQSDYHGHTTNDVVYLAWSTHKRDLFPEMRKAATKFEGTKDLGPDCGRFIPWVKNVSGKDFQLRGGNIWKDCGFGRTSFGYDEIPTFTKREDAQKWIDDQKPLLEIKSDSGEVMPIAWDIEETSIEHREKYSMGSGYYLKDGHSDSSGWSVCKRGVPSLEELQIAAAEGKLFCKEIAEDTEPVEVPEVKAGSVQIIEHPFRKGKILVVGDTYPIKEKIKALGGKWNKFEKGWEFYAHELQKVSEGLAPRQEAKIVQMDTALVSAQEEAGYLNSYHG